MDEGLAIIRSYLQGERFSFEGRHFQLHDVEPVLQPVTGSAMPLWVGARASRAGTRAGRFGCSLIIGTSHVPYNEYVTALRENGFDLATRSLGASRSVYVSDTDDAAWEEAGDELFYEARVAREWYSGAGDIAGDRLPPYETTEQRRRVAKMIGSPETVARDIIELHSRFQSEVRLDWLFFNPRPACLDIALVNRSLRLFAEEVVPRVNQALDRLPAR
jgi:alkanesulfonate monooxygenase SsuD/methylene tetrahydromethanopterin reductase-like flavin-dependent oxidoreductase (luciferase family)